MLQSYVIVGAGTAGWMTAAALSYRLKNTECVITLIESPSVPTIGVGEATIPSIIDFLEYLNIDHNDFVVQTDATFKLAIKFIDWLEKGHHYWHPFGAIGSKIDGVDFYQHWQRFKEQGGEAGFTDFSPSIAMAKLDRFFIPDPGKPTNLSKSAYALHFDAAKVATYLSKYAKSNGVQHILADVENVELSEGNHISSVVLQDDRKISGDFFVDCTGQRAILIEKALKIPYSDWSEFLPVNRAVAMQTEVTGDPHPYTEATAHEHGWRWRIPLQSRMGNGYVYSDKYCSDDDASKLLMLHTRHEAPVSEPRIIRFTTGKREKIWQGNCLSVGLSAGFLEPLESTSIYLIMKGVLNFVQMLPGYDLPQPTIDEYNRLMDIEYECIRDFIVLHYCPSRRSDSEFWRDWQTRKVPESLEIKLQLFRAQGRLYRNDLDLFAPDSWYAVLQGMGLEPEAADPLVYLSDQDKIMRGLNNGAARLSVSAGEAPLHSQYVKSVIAGVKGENGS